MRLGRRRKKKEKQRAAWDAVAATLEPPPPTTSPVVTIAPVAPAASASEPGASGEPVPPVAPPAAPDEPVEVAPISTATPVAGTEAIPVEPGPAPAVTPAPPPEPAPAPATPTQPPPPSGPPVFRFTPSGTTEMPTPVPAAPVVPLASAPVAPEPVAPAPVPEPAVADAVLDETGLDQTGLPTSLPDVAPVGLTIAPPLPPSTPLPDVAAPEPPRAPEPHATLPVVYAPTPSVPGTSVPSTQLPPQTGRLVGIPASTRRAAERMRGAQQEMAQLSMRMDAWMDQAVEMRTQLLSEWDDDTLRPSYTDFVVRAVARALVQHPELNAIVRGDSIELLPRVHVGVTLPGGNGVEIPVVRDADRRTLKTIAAASRGFGEDPGPRALESPDDEPAPTGGVAWHAPADDAPADPSPRSLTVAGSGLDTDVMVDVPASFVVASLGMYGVDAFTPIVMSPNVATLAIGRVRDTTRWEGDHPTRAAAMTLTLAWDHRAVDGTTAAEFLAEVRDILEQPYRLLVD